MPDLAHEASPKSVLHKLAIKTDSKLLAVVALFAWTTANATDSKLQPSWSPEQRRELVQLQRSIIAELSGHHATPAGQRLRSRSTPTERAVAANYLIDRGRQLGLTMSEQKYRWGNTNSLADLLIAPRVGKNLLTLVPADRPNAPYVIVGAHYDSDPEVPGAGDNATGVALVLTLAQKLNQQTSRRFNFWLVLFDQEEDDEVGSSAFANFLREEDYQVHSVHISDLAGWDDDGDGVIEVQSVGPNLAHAYRTAAEQLDVELQFTQGASSDNKSFMAHDFHTAGIFGDVTHHLHQPSDTIDTVDFDFLANSTELIFHVLTTLNADSIHP